MPSNSEHYLCILRPCCNVCWNSWLCTGDHCVPHLTVTRRTAQVNSVNIKHDCWLMLSLLHALSDALCRNYSILALLNNWATVHVRERALSIVSDVNIKHDYCIMPSQCIVQVFYHWVQARIFNHHNMFDYVVEEGVGVQLLLPIIVTFAYTDTWTYKG
jgi:hypothetical protein